MWLFLTQIILLIKGIILPAQLGCPGEAPTLAEQAGEGEDFVSEENLP